ncbi:MAG: glycosyltransferase, partial [Actinomycetota bacterium]|nr:glycosyltransferase [Actinomycetota bacterium]
TRALDRLGVVQTVVTARPDGAPSEEPFARHGTVFRVGSPRRRPRQLYSVPAWRLVPALARDVDLVHAHIGEDLAVVPIAASAARRHGIPLVLTIHCSLEHTLRSVDVRTLMLKLLGAPIERWGEQRAAAVITLTERLRSLLVCGGLDAAKVHAIPSGVEPHLFSASGPRPLPELEGPRVVFVGRLVAAKGVSVLLAATERLRTRGAHLIYVGDGPERATLERDAREHGLEDRVHVTGFVPHDRVPSFLLSADVLVLPSLYEEMGSIQIEAMEAEVPIVASRTGGIVDVIRDGENGLLVEPGAVSQLSEAIDRVLEDRRLANRLRLAGRMWAANFHWDALAQRVLDVYGSVLGSDAVARRERDQRVEVVVSAGSSAVRSESASPSTRSGPSTRR